MFGTCFVMFLLVPQFSNHLLRTIVFVALLFCVVADCVLCLDLFLVVPWAGLQSVIVASPTFRSLNESR